MKSLFLIAAGLAAIAAPASAAVIYLDFEGIAPYPNNNNVLINEYYNGGAASNGNIGPNYGVEFTSAAQLLCLNTAGTVCSNTSRGGLGIPTSQRGAMYFPGANPIMNVAAGFDTGFSFVYSAPYTAGTSVSVYSGLNGTGTLLGSMTLSLTPAAGCDYSIANGAGYCPFAAAGLTFAGVAQSVVFGGPVNTQVFDDITFGSAMPGGVPEPATWALLIAGFGLVGTAARRRRRAVHA